MRENIRIAIVGLGYVGLPLAVEFSKKYKCIGYDIDQERIGALRAGHDRTLEVSDTDLSAVLTDTCNTLLGLYCTNNIREIASCNYFIITVPTPVDKYKQPDLRPLSKASEIVGTVLKRGDTVVYESTVYPGATEEKCIPILERISGLKLNVDFYAGYSPERVNPGDKSHAISNILKIVSGSTQETTEKLSKLYGSILKAGVHKATSIRVAEAAKVIENAQRDINIAFVNELAKIFNRLDIDTWDVLRAAGTKWNFLHFSPGLVGGHCIGVDPYYLAQKAQEAGYHPEIILAGRRLNDSMGDYVAHEVIRLMIKKDIPIKGSRILLLGITFKENCPDIRNTKVIDIIKVLQHYEIDITIYDPWIQRTEVKQEYDLSCCETLDHSNYFDAAILAVAHNEFKSLDIQALCKEKKVIYDVKGVLEREKADARL